MTAHPARSVGQHDGKVQALEFHKPNLSQSFMNKHEHEHEHKHKVSKTQTRISMNQVVGLKESWYLQIFIFLP